MKHEITLEERLRKIDNFFDNLSAEDFEKIALEAGAREINSRSGSFPDCFPQIQI